MRQFSSQHIYLVRHADYNNPSGFVAGRLPLTLSQRGIEQSLWLQRYFSDKNINLIYSSRVERCKQTSEAISNQQTTIIFDTRLLEVFSAYQGRQETDFIQSGRHFFSHNSGLGGESLKDVQERMISFFNEVTASNLESIVICTHGDPLYSLQLFLSGKSLPDEFTDFTDSDYLNRGDVLKITTSDTSLKIHPIIRNPL